MSHKKTILYAVLGIGGLAAVFAIVWQSIFPQKPKTAGSAAASNVSSGHSAGSPGTSPGTGPGSGTPTNTGSNATTPEASTNLGYTVVSWNEIKVNDKLNANEDVYLYRTGKSSYLSEQVTPPILKGNWVGQVVTKTTTGATVRNWSGPGLPETLFNIPIKSYRKIT